MNDTAANPFSPRAVLALVLFGAVVFVALLWMIGAGMMDGSANDGGAHAEGKGLNGYAAMATLLEKRGYTVRRSRSVAALDDPGLLVLTPPQYTDGKELNDIVEKRRNIGPTLVVTPKWNAVKAPAQAPGAKTGWVVLAGTSPPEWPGFLDNLSVEIKPMGGQKARWLGAGLSGELPVPGEVLSGQGEGLVPLVTGSQDGRILAGYIGDDGMYPDLEDMAIEGPDEYGEDEELYPIVVVFEPDLLDNYGMAKPVNARLAAALVQAASENAGKTITFDMTLNGLRRSTNLLTLAFTPPFLAATLCLILAGITVAWRAFLRFGPPRRAVRAIAFGKRALVSNAAGLIRRTRRLHLIAGPYAEHARERLAKALALPRLADAAATEAAIDRALASRNPASKPFSAIAARLRAARRPHDILEAAQDLHSLERTLRT